MEEIWFSCCSGPLNLDPTPATHARHPQPELLNPKPLNRKSYILCTDLGLGPACLDLRAAALVAETLTANPRKLEHGFRMISAGIPSALPSVHEDNDVPTFWLLL